MYISVQLLNGYSRSLTYRAPDSTVQVGMLVQVPLQARIELGIIVSINSALENHIVPEQVRSIIGLASFPEDQKYHQFITQLASWHCIDPVLLIKRMRSYVLQGSIQKEKEQISEQLLSNQSVILTDEQLLACRSIEQAIHVPSYQPFVLHGVTGSGKTEVYKHLIRETIALNKSVVFLLPEAGLAHQFEQRLARELTGAALVYGFHSLSARTMRREVWNSLLKKNPIVIVGVHLPILLPIAHLGLIIVDEEHDAGYQEKHHPKINTVYAALLRATLYQIPIVLGSATPSLTCLYNVEHRHWPVFHLTKRFAGTFPTVQIVSLIQKKKRAHFWISSELQEAIAQQLLRKEQTIIFINRRGLSSSLQCEGCGFIYQCYQCTVSLTVHANERLQCHYCGSSVPLPIVCKGCGGKDQFIKKGIGTQKIVQILTQLFPAASIERLDMDITKKKGESRRIFADIEKGAVDIIVGTQTVAKGLHFPRVTLVGIIWADANLHFPSFAATEHVVQQLVQVAGRAGRCSSASKVIVQTLNEHPIFKYIDEKLYQEFYNYEIENRINVAYPPYQRLVEIELKNRYETQVEKDAIKVMHELISRNKKETLGVTVLGPTVPQISRIEGIHIRRIYLKGSQFERLLHLVHSIHYANYRSSIYVTPHPLS